MIIMNGMVGGVTLLIGGVKHREHRRSICRAAANAYPCQRPPCSLATFALIMPDYTQTTPGPIYSVAQQFVLVIVSLALYLLFLVLQTGRYHGYFEDAGAAAGGARGRRACLVLDRDAGRPTWRPSSHLVEQFRAADRLPARNFASAGAARGHPYRAPGRDARIDRRGEGGARQSDAARAVNIFLGSVLATIGLTIPSVLVINHLLERPVVLGVEHTDLALLILTLALSMITFTSGRTNMLQGVVHLLLFAAYILLIFQA